RLALLVGLVGDVAEVEVGDPGLPALGLPLPDQRAESMPGEGLPEDRAPGTRERLTDVVLCDRRELRPIRGRDLLGNLVQLQLRPVGLHPTDERGRLRIELRARRRDERGVLRLVGADPRLAGGLLLRRRRLLDELP